MGIDSFASDKFSVDNQEPQQSLDDILVEIGVSGATPEERKEKIANIAKKLGYKTVEEMFAKMKGTKRDTAILD